MSDLEQQRRRAANRERKRAEKRALVVIALLAFLVALVWVVKAAAHPKPLPRAWLRGALCVHREERSSWRDHGAPYYGGMQMDLSFMKAYGRRLLRSKGTADRWTPHEQLHVAHRGWKARGWQPWPVAARRCGLL